MTTFSCKRDESIVIGDGIIVTVLGIHGQFVELGIEYPNGDCERRSEMFELVGQAADNWGEDDCG